MEKTFTYYDVNDTEINYTPNEDELKTAIVDELFYTYFSDEERKSFSANQVCVIKKALKNITDDNDNWEDLLEDYESELKEHFEQDAYNNEKYKGEDL